MATRSSEDLRVYCTRKEGYSHSKARRVARRIRRSTDEVVSEYRCDECKRWHIGTDNQKRLRAAHIRRTKKRRGRGERTGVQ